MRINDYQVKALRTVNKNLESFELELHALHGMSGEVGEIHSIYQKAYQGHEVDDNHLMKEVGDLMWFIAEYCYARGWTLNEVCAMNIEKLMARFPEGFTTDNSINRAEGDI